MANLRDRNNLQKSARAREADENELVAKLPSAKRARKTKTVTFPKLSAPEVAESGGGPKDRQVAKAASRKRNAKAKALGKQSLDSKKEPDDVAIPIPAMAEAMKKKMVSEEQHPDDSSESMSLERSVSSQQRQLAEDSAASEQALTDDNAAVARNEYGPKHLSPSRGKSTSHQSIQVVEPDPGLRLSLTSSLKVKLEFQSRTNVRRFGQIVERDIRASYPAASTEVPQSHATGSNNASKPTPLTAPSVTSQSHLRTMGGRMPETPTEKEDEETYSAWGTTQQRRESLQPQSISGPSAEAESRMATLLYDFPHKSDKRLKARRDTRLAGASRQ